MDVCAHQCMYAHAFVLIIRLHWPLRWHHSLWIVNTEQIKIPSKNLPRKLVLREREASAFQHRCLFPPLARELPTGLWQHWPTLLLYCDPISSLSSPRSGTDKIYMRQTFILFLCQHVLVCVFKHLRWFKKYDTWAHFPVLGSKFDKRPMQQSQ